jgi:general secretion pathway protein C
VFAAYDTIGLMKRLSFWITLGLACLLSAILAFWGVRLAEKAPPVIPLTPPDPAPKLDYSLQARLFGAGVQTGAVANISIRLAGVIAPGSAQGRGVAVLAVESKPMRAYRTGDEIAPGIRLLQVQPTRVVIEQNGVRSEVLLPASATRSVAVN